MLKNKLGINNPIELAKEEERITKTKAIELFKTKKHADASKHCGGIFFCYILSSGRSLPKTAVPGKIRKQKKRSSAFADDRINI